MTNYYQLIDWLIGSLSDWVVADLVTDLLTSLLTNVLTNWLADWFNNWLADCVTDRLIDWLAGSLTHWLNWLADVLRLMLRKGIKSNFSVMPVKLLQLLMKLTDFFISDQICPADVSRLQQPGFWAYLQYCKCVIDCFVIQLLSEPDKLNLTCSLFEVRFNLTQI